MTPAGGEGGGPTVPGGGGVRQGWGPHCSWGRGYVVHIALGCTGGGPHQQPPALAGRGAMGRGQGRSHVTAMVAHTYLLTGLASLTGGTSGARQTLGRKKKSDETPRRWVTKGGEERGNVTPTLNGLSPHKGRGHPSPGSQERRRDLVHLFLQRDPGGEGTSVRGGQSAPEPLLQWPSVAVGRQGLVDTHGRAGRTLGTSFTIFASSTLWKREKRVLRAQPQPAAP